MKSVEELTQAQERLHAEIDRIAEENHLFDADQETIKDGVNDIPGYLASQLKIMWILKEPWEKGEEEGEIGRGGWNAYSLFDSTKAWKIKTYKAMAYVKYGFENNVYWDGLQKVKKDESLIHVLKDIAYVNISKMPGRPESPVNHIHDCARIWKPIVEKQISVYNPDVIIYGGTSKFLIPATELTTNKRIMKIQNEEWHPEIITSIYRYNGRWVIAARHPGRYNEVYIDSLIDALHFVYEQIKSHRK